jgi:hypothetical protein
MNGKDKHPRRRIERKALGEQLAERQINWRIAQLRCHFTFHGQTTLFWVLFDVSTFQNWCRLKKGELDQFLTGLDCSLDCPPPANEAHSAKAISRFGLTYGGG